MPYEYRKLSAKDRAEIVEARRQRGYPLHSPPHPFRERGTYLITAVNFEHKEIMRTPQRRTEFEEILLNGFFDIKAEVVGWVILYNHYHILATVESLNLVSKIIQLIHGRTSHGWNIQDGLKGKRKVWYRFVDRLMRDDEHLNQTLNYIHYNPVKHGYVRDIFEWQWSSVCLYEVEKGTDWLMEHWKKYPPSKDFGKDWDI